MFISKSILGAASLLFASCAATSNSGVQSAKPFSVHTFQSGADGFMTNSYWIEGSKGIVVLDTQFLPDIAENLLADIRKISQKPILYAVNLHANPDKFNGNIVFKRIGAEIVTNRASRDVMPSVDSAKREYWTSMDAYAARYPKNVPFADSGVFEGFRVLDLGGVKVTLHELKNEGVSQRQTVAIVDDESSRAVFVGDLVHTQVHAWQEHGTPHAWIKALDEVLVLVSRGVVYPGRGLPEKFDENSGAIREQQKYLTAYINAMQASQQLAQNRQARVDFVTQVMTQAFPNYKMSDFINYSLPQQID